VKFWHVREMDASVGWMWRKIESFARFAASTCMQQHKCQFQIGAQLAKLPHQT